MLLDRRRDRQRAGRGRAAGSVHHRVAAGAGAVDRARAAVAAAGRLALLEKIRWPRLTWTAST